jgi:hypothetical protein
MPCSLCAETRAARTANVLLGKCVVRGRKVAFSACTASRVEANWPKVQAARLHALKNECPIIRRADTVARVKSCAAHSAHAARAVRVYIDGRRRGCEAASLNTSVGPRAGGNVHRPPSIGPQRRTGTRDTTRGWEMETEAILSVEQLHLLLERGSLDPTAFYGKVAPAATPGSVGSSAPCGRWQLNPGGRPAAGSGDAAPYGSQQVCRDVAAVPATAERRPC